MSNSKDAAHAYVESRFPRASAPEREKIVQDWLTKDAQAEGIAADFERRICPVRNLDILDAGAGNGGIAIAFARRGAHVQGVEIEEELVTIARSAAQAAGLSVSFICSDGLTLPFPDQTFDAVLSISVIEHVDDPVQYFSEIRRVLKPDGFLYLAFPNRLHPKETHTGLWGLSYLPIWLARLYVRIANRNPLEDNGLHFYSYWAVRRLLRASAPDWVLKEEHGASTNPLKRGVKALLRAFGIPHHAFLPHVMLVLQAPRVR